MSNVFRMKRRDRYYRLHDSYHEASLGLIGQFNIRNNINGELVHEDDMDFEILENDDVIDEELDENDDSDDDDYFGDIGVEQEYNYESFVFDRG